MIKLLEKHGAKPLMAPMHVKNAREVPEYEIDAKELDFTDNVDITKGIFTIASWRGTKLAVKKLGDELFTDKEKLWAVRDELELLQKIRHPNYYSGTSFGTSNGVGIAATDSSSGYNQFSADLKKLKKERGSMAKEGTVLSTMTLLGFNLAWFLRTEGCCCSSEPPSAYWLGFGWMCIWCFGCRLWSSRIFIQMCSFLSIYVKKCMQTYSCISFFLLLN
ncbi:hypothetical protein Hanom_Chr04g00348731 [Helianthus anomalus]